MNTCGRDLTCADMIGNFILMPLDRERQERLYADHLRPIERGFERHGEEHFDVFIRDFLTLRTGEVPKQGEEYAAFRTHARSRRVEDAGPEALSADLRNCADHYRAMVLGEEADAELALAFAELARLDMKPVWPFLLHLYGDHGQAQASWWPGTARSTAPPLPTPWKHASSFLSDSLNPTGPIPAVWSIAVGAKRPPLVSFTPPLVKASASGGGAPVTSIGTRRTS